MPSYFAARRLRATNIVRIMSGGKSAGHLRTAYHWWSRRSALELMRLTEYLDINTQRRAGLIKCCKLKGTRNRDGCWDHVYVDDSADLDAVESFANFSRPSVCNAIGLCLFQRG